MKSPAFERAAPNDPLASVAARLAPAAKAVEMAGLLSLLALSSWTVPPRNWRRLCIKLATTRPWFLTERRRAEAERVPPFISELAGVPARTAADYYLSTLYEEALQVFRLYRLGGWQPTIEVTGIEHLQQAHEAGKGAVVWSSIFAYQATINKMALHQAGFPLNYLSDPHHGLFLFNIERLHQLVQRAEERNLQSRVVIRRKPAIEATRVLRQLLAENKVVGITLGDEASQLIQMPFFGGVLIVPSGPLNLSRVSGAPLLPSFTIQETSERFRVEINPPVQFAGASRQEQLAAGAAQYASLLEGYVRRYPLLWSGWRLHWSGGASR
jgi:lauroyl/myristoyl acyltransferase